MGRRVAMRGRGGVASRNHDGLALRGHPQLDPSTLLRVSGPSWGWIPAAESRNDGKGGGWAAPPLGVDSRVGAYQRPTYNIFDRLGDWNYGEKRKRDVWDEGGAHFGEGDSRIAPTGEGMGSCLRRNDGRG